MSALCKGLKALLMLFNDKVSSVTLLNLGVASVWVSTGKHDRSGCEEPQLSSITVFHWIDDSNSTPVK